MNVSNNKSGQPLVSIVTPVYNGAEFLAECIESILAQTYHNWDFTIVDNCSTDATLEIARRYAERDPRIRITENQQFLRAIPNHNHALRQISPQSKYCKVVFADDWIFPECIERMVALAEGYPAVGIVGAYGMQGKDVMWTGLPYPSPWLPGREVCRLLLLDEVYVFGTATSLLYRSDLVRAHDPFFNESNLHGDMEACVELLKESDFGFVHQILTFKRVRAESLGALTEDINTLVAGHLHNLVAHGRDFLSDQEYAACYRRIVSQYYNFLAVTFLRGRQDKKFWDYHKRKLTDAGVGFSRLRLASALALRLLRAVLNPYETVEKKRRTKTASPQAAALSNAQTSVQARAKETH
jgi:glycosyltransferase involved in cell wall biosynthesis